MAILTGVFGVLVAYITHLRSSNSGLKKDLKQSQFNEAAAIEAIEKKQMLEKAIASIEQKTNDDLGMKRAEFDKNPDAFGGDLDNVRWLSTGQSKGDHS